MATLVSSILEAVGARTDLTTTLPDGDELSTRVNFADQAQQDWYEHYDWKVLKHTQPITVLVSTSSVGLDTRFAKLMSPVYDFSTGLDNPTKYIEIPAENRFSKLSTDKYCYVSGDDATGKYLTINPALTSGASAVFDWKSTVSSLATTSDTVTCTSKQFMTERTTYYVFQGRSDARFPQVEDRSLSLLDSLVEQENTPTGGEENRVPDWQRTQNFRIGE